MLLVDGSSYLYRAYHALPDLRSPDGFPTGAIHGVLAMMKWLRERYPAEHAVCVFDAKGPTFRDDWYAEYKAQRAPMPEALAQQIEPIHEAVRLLGWPVLEVPGIEADDAIGTLARIGRGQRPQGADLHRRQGPGATGHAQVTLINTMAKPPESAGRRGREGQVRRAARAHRRLPDAGRRHRGQRARRRQGRPEDGRRSGWPNTARSTA